MLNKYVINGIRMIVRDRPHSMSTRWIADEFRLDEYGLGRFSFRPGDVIVDVGAHVGMFSIYMTKRFADLRIIALEPDPRNFANLLFNIEANGATGIVAEHCAVTADGRSFAMAAPAHNSGGSTGFRLEGPDLTHATVSSTTLDEVFARHDIATCQLLKIDCEGAEHEILKTTAVLDRVERLPGEFHINDRLRAQGHRLEDLIALVEARFPADRLSVTSNVIDG